MLKEMGYFDWYIVQNRVRYHVITWMRFQQYQDHVWLALHFTSVGISAYTKQSGLLFHGSEVSS